MKAIINLALVNQKNVTYANKLASTGVHSAGSIPALANTAKRKYKQRNPVTNSV